MKSFLLVALFLAPANAFVYLNFHNRCDWDFDLVEINHAGKKSVVAKIPGKDSYCILNFEGKLAYQAGMDGKLRTEFEFSLLRTYYGINAIHGYDMPMKLVPLLFGQTNGAVLECKEEGCPDAIQNENEFKNKIHQSGCDTLHIHFCSHLSEGQMKCHNNQ